MPIFVALDSHLPHNITTLLTNYTPRNLDHFTKATVTIGKSQFQEFLVNRKIKTSERILKWLEVVLLVIILIGLLALALRLVWVGRYLFWKWISRI